MTLLLEDKCGSLVQILIIYQEDFSRVPPDAIKRKYSCLYCSTVRYRLTFIVTSMKKLRIANNNSLRRFLVMPEQNCSGRMFVQLGFKSYVNIT